MIYEFVGGALALDFTNTVHDHGAANPDDDLKAPDDFVGWALQAGLLRPAEARRLRKAPADENLFQRALVLRETLYEIFSRSAKGRKLGSEPLRVLQGLYQDAILEVEFRPVDDHYELSWRPTIHPLDRVVVEIVRSAVNLLLSGALARVRQCAGEACSWLFVDTSRNGLRRWCDMKACGNRNKVRLFRRRNRKHPRSAKP